MMAFKTPVLKIILADVCCTLG